MTIFLPEYSFSVPICATLNLPKMVPETGLEPVQEVIPRDFKSLASTNSATPAEKIEENGGTFRIRTGDGDFADLCLTSWLRCRPKNFD